MHYTVLIGVGIVAILVIAIYVFPMYTTKRQQTPPAEQDRMLTSQELDTYVLKAKDLNDRRDYSLVEGRTNYAETIGIWNDRPVEFAFKCWGDLCPDNGTYFVRYKDVPKEACSAIGGHIVEGYSGWGAMTYGGCSPVPPAS